MYMSKHDKSGTSVMTKTAHEDEKKLEFRACSPSVVWV